MEYEMANQKSLWFSIKLKGIGLEYELGTQMKGMATLIDY